VRHGLRRVEIVIADRDYFPLARFAKDWHMRPDTLLRKLIHSAACAVRTQRASSQGQMAKGTPAHAGTSRRSMSSVERLTLIPNDPPQATTPEAGCLFSSP
jgi:hypothetical protein